MPGKFDGTTLEITAIPTAGALLPDVKDSTKNLTNAAGITMVGNTLYCVKTSGSKTSILKIDNYSLPSSGYSVVGNYKVPYFALGLSKIGEMLYILAETKAAYGGTTRIIKCNTAGKKQGEYLINHILPDGALGIAHTGKGEEFFVLGYGRNEKPVVKRILISGNQAVEKESFEIQNSGYGHTFQLQDIYYHLDYGLFVITNDELDTGRNKILLIDYKAGTSRYTPSAVFEVNLSKEQYKQYNLESICMKGGNLVLAANIILADGKAEDRVSILKGISFANGTYSFTCGMKKGMSVPNKKIGAITTTNFGAIAMSDSNKLYGIKAGSNNSYNSADSCAASFFSLSDYNNVNSNGKDDIYDVEAGETGCLYHANGMDYYNGNLYIACGETDKVGQNSFIRMSTDGLQVKRFSNGKNRANAISHYKNNTDQFIVFTGTDVKEDQSTSLPVYQLLVGRFNDASKTFDVSQTYYFLNNGYGTVQDIFYREDYGLFIVTCNIITHQDTNEYQTTANRVLHLNMSRRKSLTLKNGEKRNVIIPDFALNNDGNKNEFYSFELESLALDPQTNNLLVAVNANKAEGTHAGADFVYRFSSLTFQ